MANTRETLGDEATLRGLIENTLETLEEDGVTLLPNNALRYNKGLKKVVFPAVTQLSEYSFSDCTNLEEADFNALIAVPSNCFKDDSKLKHLILRKSSMTSLGNTNALTGTKIAAENGAVYVPSDLLATYRVDSKWKNYFITTIDKYPTTVYETIEDSWPTIVQKITAGTAYSEYGQGATKSFTVSNGTNTYTALAQLIAVGKDELVNGANNTNLTTWIVKNLPFKMQMNSTGTNANGWKASAARTLLNGTVFNSLDADLQANIKPVKKTYWNYTTTSTLSTGTDGDAGDKLWIPSAREIFSGDTDSYGDHENSGCDYTDFFSNANARKKKYNGSADYYWTRSAFPGNSYSFRDVDGSGAVNSNVANASNGAALGFCI